MCRPKYWEYENYNGEQEGEGMSRLGQMRIEAMELVAVAMSL